MGENKEALWSFKADMDERIENGFLDGAINRTKSKLMRYPDSLELYSILARAYMEKGEGETSWRYIRQAENYGSSQELNYLKLLLSLEEENFQEAGSILESMKGLDQEDPYFRDAEIKLALGLKDYELGLGLIEKADQSKYLAEKMDCLYRTGRMEECKKLANKLRLREPNSREGKLALDYIRKLKNEEIEGRLENKQLDQHLSKLSRLIGLKAVKHEVNKAIGIVKFNQNRERMGIVPENPHSYHMAFYGNPGTGKTTVARLLGDIYRELGILEKGHLVEVDRSDLVEGYIGQTATKTKEVIESAYGGVLFIDEAYALARGGDNDFGGEALDTLIKEMEDNRDKFILILAGYTDEMRELFKLNPGLKSRLATEVYFEDYNDNELLEIGRLIADENKYRMTDDGERAFSKKIEQEKMDQYFSNARACRNIIEDAIREKAYRVGERVLSKEEMTSLEARDFGINLEEAFGEDLDQEMEKLDRLIGLGSVKNQLEEIKQLALANKEREERGLISNRPSYHMMFTGNPGTGKTTVARIVAGIFKSLGILSRGHLVEVDRSDLVGQYIGQTGPKTLDVIKSAYGGVLFIDEAYALARGGDKDFGGEAIDTLIKEMEDNRDKFILILAGYRGEMRQLMKMNPGLESRISRSLDFEDYREDELLDIARLIVADSGYTMDPEAESAFMEKIRAEKRQEFFSNARACRNLIEDAIMKNALRVGGKGLSAEEISRLTAGDFGLDPSRSFGDDIDLEMAKLEGLIGLGQVKESINRIKNMLLVNKRRKEMGIESKTSSYHMMFTGNPGTGKTTVARIVAGIFKSMGILSKGHLVEVDRSDLVGEHIGQTGPKTLDVIKSAYGGVLFIDEAYALNSSGSNDFGKEALSTLIKEMEDKRDGLVVILAGYTEEMNDLLDLNPGLKSRLANIIEFEDYSCQEMFEIFKVFLQGEIYYLSQEADQAMEDYIYYITENKDRHFGNARTARNIFEDLKMIQSERVVYDLEADILEISLEDVEKLKNR